MIITAKPIKFKLYQNTSKKSAEQVRTETGADIVINCWLYDMKKFKANCDVKVNGVILSNDEFQYWGYGFNDGDSRMTMSNNMSIWKNYFACVGMLKDGKKLTMYYDSNVGRSTYRSAVGFKTDGTIVILCEHRNMLIPDVQKKMMELGCVDAINLDGGGSVQIASCFGNLKSSRRVHGYLCIWIEKDSAKAPCPYREPTVNVKSGSMGDNARWVQWHLQKLGFYSGSIDGIFGKNSTRGLIEYQKSVFTDPKDHDGICGKQTRTALKSSYEEA